MPFVSFLLRSLMLWKVFTFYTSRQLPTYDFSLLIVKTNNCENKKNYNKHINRSYTPLLRTLFDKNNEKHNIHTSNKKEIVYFENKHDNKVLPTSRVMG